MNKSAQEYESNIVTGHETVFLKNEKITRAIWSSAPPKKTLQKWGGKRRWIQSVGKLKKKLLPYNLSLIYWDQQKHKFSEEKLN